MRKGNGFTLIELMVAISVLVVLLSLGIPGFQATLQGNRVSTQANDLVSALATARAEAVRSNEEITLVTDDGGDDWTVGFAIENGSGDALRVFGPASDALTLDATDNNGNAVSQLEFRGDGTRPPGNGNVTFALQPTGDCYGDMRREITVTVGGGTRTERMACN